MNVIKQTLAAVILCMQAVQVSAGETLYHFRDEQGVPHFSNQPLEPRYRPLDPAGEALQVQPQQPLAEVNLTGPDHATLGDTFEVTVSMATAQPGSGHLELTFDPDTISLQAISVDASVIEAGKVRIELNLTPGAEEQTLANLSFQAVAQQPTSASIQVTQLELYKPNGEALPAHSGAWMTVTLLQ
jgi:hypothetical protein